MGFPNPSNTGTPPLGADIGGGGEGGGGGGGYSYFEKCWRTIKTCTVEIKTGSCCNGFCN